MNIPTDGKTSKGRVMSKLSKYEKNTQSVYIGLNIRNKIVDGKKVTTMSIDNNQPWDGNGSMPLPEEFTDREAFKNALFKRIDEIEKAL